MAIALNESPSFLVYGPHGSGLTTALQAFREFGYMTVSGAALNGLEQLLAMAQAENRPAALSPEINPQRVSPEEALSQLKSLKVTHPDLKFLYLSTPSEVLLQRFSASEKSHPYEKDSRLSAIDHEQMVFSALKTLSDYHIDTSTTSSRELRHKIAKILKIDLALMPMVVTLASFGFKHGVPSDAEMVFDMRFLPNPFYDERLRPQTGLDQDVKDYIFSFPETEVFLTHWQNLLAHSLPLYQKQGKTRITIGIGCTGGQHRSVAMTMAISEFLKQAFPDYQVHVVHREQHHWPKQPALQ